jgi:hypothetical protein
LRAAVGDVLESTATDTSDRIRFLTAFQIMVPS